MGSKQRGANFRIFLLTLRTFRQLKSVRLGHVLESVRLGLVDESVRLGLVHESVRLGLVHESVRLGLVQITCFGRKLNGGRLRCVFFYQGCGALDGPLLAIICAKAMSKLPQT